MVELIGMSGPSVAWKDVSSIEDARTLIDYGVILNWRDVRKVRKNLSEPDHQAFVHHLVERFCEAHETRLQEEIMAETLLNWLAHSKDEKDIQTILETLFVQPGHAQACIKLVEIALTAETSETEHDDEVFSTAVSLICELGLAVHDLKQRFPDQVQEADRIVSHIATYLLSVSNNNNMCIRLSLLNYFGITEQDQKVKLGFNKVMSRFGHTVLDQLFSLLFEKKTEAVALQYILENMPSILGADRHAQRIVHETWKFYMLKRPQRFGLFLNTLAAYIAGLEGVAGEARIVYAQHLGVLLRVVSEVNHKELAREIIFSLAQFRKFEDCRAVIDGILQDDLVRASFKDVLRGVRDVKDDHKVSESASRFVSAKRGRRPSFQRADGVYTLHQVQFLSQQIVAKAS